MLGNQIAEETGRIAVMRVLDAEGPQVEVSARTKGKVLAIDYQGRTTYTSAVQPGGHIFGEGQGVYLTANGWRQLPRCGNGSKPGTSVQAESGRSMTVSEITHASPNLICPASRSSSRGEPRLHGVNAGLPCASTSSSNVARSGPRLSELDHRAVSPLFSGRHPSADAP